MTDTNDLRELMAKAIAAEIGRQDYEPFNLDGTLILPWLDQGEVDFGKVADAALTIVQPMLDAAYARGREDSAVIADGAVQLARDAVSQCRDWSPAQAEWSRARDLGLDIADAIRANKEKSNVG